MRARSGDGSHHDERVPMAQEGRDSDHWLDAAKGLHAAKCRRVSGIAGAHHLVGACSEAKAAQPHPSHRPVQQRPAENRLDRQHCQVPAGWSQRLLPGRPFDGADGP